MATGTPQDIASKWSQNLGNSTTSIQKGVNAVTTSPTAAAAAAVDLWQQRVSSPAARDKFTRNLQRVSLEQWRQSMLNKGVARISSGAQAAIPKVVAFMTQFLPYVENVAQQVRQMPKNTLEDRIQRAVAQIRGNAAFVRQ
jgi:hypothetical protein